MVHYNTSQTKDMPVRYGQPLSNFQLATNNKIDQDHYTARMKGHKFTPYAGVTYDLNENQSLYASYTQIFKQQDNVDVTTKTTLPPLLGSNYEIGWKGSFFNQRLNSSLALFTLEQKIAR
ncbi:TonB-dependent receptor domain-containing protein [Haemophilus pittmaniae]|uniref:TonB-dependent receptor domain-containing protein n=1 Tax=Haemophilus pittmaniae TaxID=249188 RepID=UPI003463D1CD